ncbi:MAG: alpha-N-arabinofuranosidase [Acidimicrobiales bacterium]|nr:alpha-N-arabinofuranosidase [Acidimicrobiales bacterium]
MGQDPWVVPFEGSLLLVQSAVHDTQIWIHRFPDFARMHDSERTVIWTPRRRSDHGRQIWAPELHRIGWRWYVYYAASDGENRNHRTYVLEAEHPLGPYRELGKVYDPAHDTWAIDLTVLRHDGKRYAVWSGWDGADDGFPQNLYVAPMSNPWTIAGERTLISRPEHDWETSVAPINEGPQVLRNNRQDKLFIVYSADASWTTAYKMGLLEFVGGDITDPASWQKLSRPILTGGGHGCFVDIDGDLYAVYHRKLTADPGWSDREIRYEPVSWDSAGYPVIGRRRDSAGTAGPPPAADDTPSSSFGPGGR